MSNRAISCQLDAIVDLACSEDYEFEIFDIARDMQAAHQRLVNKIERRRRARAAYLANEDEI